MPFLGAEGTLFMHPNNIVKDAVFLKISGVFTLFLNNLLRNVDFFFYFIIDSN